MQRTTDARPRCVVQFDHRAASGVDDTDNLGMHWRSEHAGDQKAGLMGSHGAVLVACVEIRAALAGRGLTWVLTARGVQ